MNRIYRVIFNDDLGMWQAVSELVSSRGKPGRCRGRLIAALSLALCGSPAHAQNSLPTGGKIVAGTGAIAQGDGVMTVTQTSARLAADWQSFSIGGGQRVDFKQPSVDAVALNRVLGADVSVIQGALTANGQVFLVNPNGILFAPGAQVDVGGIVASTLDISTADFMAGNYRFEGTSTNAVINEGNITTAAGGTIAMIAARIINTGNLSAPDGRVLMGAGSKVTLDLGGPVKIEVEEGAIDALIEQGGAIRADGGLIYLTAKAAGNLASTVINHTGISEARTLAADASGAIMLLGEGDAIHVAGTLDARAAEAGRGGRIVTTGDAVVIARDAHLNASGVHGGGEVLVGGSWQNEDASVAEARTTRVEVGAVIEANALNHGDGGTVVVWSDIDAPTGGTSAHGVLEAKGGEGGGDGGRVETSGYHLDVSSVAVSTLAAHGRTGLWLLDPYNIIIENGSTSNITTSGATTYNSHAGGAVLSIAAIDAALADNNVTIQTGGSGAEAGDIFWQDDYTYSGSAIRSLTLSAHRDIVVNGFIKSDGAALSTAFTADADGNGSGGVLFAKDVETAGGSFTVNGVGAIFSGNDAQAVRTGGGNFAVNGETIIANPDGLTIDTAGGDVVFAGAVNSGNRFSYDPTLTTFADAKLQYGSTDEAPGTTYLGTLTSALENTAAGAAADGLAGWLGGDDLLHEGVWRWTTGPEGAADGGQGQIFWLAGGNALGLNPANEQGAIGYTGHEGSYVNWNTGEPNNSNNEDALQFGFSAANLWNDLPADSNLLGAILETNLAPSALTIDAGSGRVIFGEQVGQDKALASLDVTAASIAIDGASMHTVGDQVYRGDVTLGSLAQFTNPSFEDGLTGWTITNNQVYLNGVSTIAGFATPNDTSFPNFVVGGCNTSTGANCDTTRFSGSFSTSLSNDVAGGSGAYSLVMNSNGWCDSGYCITRGPYVVSDSTVSLPTGGMVSFKWQAQGGGDAYDVYGYLLDVATGEAQTILNATGGTASATQPWTTAAVNVDQAGTYKFVFVSGSWDATGGMALGAQLFIDDIQASGGAKLIDAAKVDFRGTLAAADNKLTLRADKIDFNGTVSGSSEITLEQRSETQAITVGGSASADRNVLDLSTVELGHLEDGFEAINVGARTGSGGVTVVGAATFHDPLHIRDGSGGIVIADALTTTAGNRLTLESEVGSTQTAAGAVTAGGGLALLGVGGEHLLTAALNDVGTLAADTGSIAFSNAQSLAIGEVGTTSGITATGPIAIDTASGDLTAAAKIATTATTDDAIVLNAGRETAAGTASGGNIIFSGDPAISTGSGGRTVLYTGSIADSSGVSAKVGYGSGRFRYHSDEATTHFSAALGSGIHAVYREMPGTVTVRASDHQKVYDGQVYGGSSGITVSGLLNGDVLSGTVGYASGLDVGIHTLSANGVGSGLGYAVAFVDGSLTVTPRPLAIVADAQSKVYGDADPVLGFVAESVSAGRGLIAGDALEGALTRTAGETVGNYAISRGTLANANYAIDFISAELNIAKRSITLVADAASKIYGEADPALSVHLVSGSTLGSVTVSDTLAEVTGNLWRQTGEDVGSYDVLLGTGDRADNYSISYVSDNDALRIDSRPLSIAAAAQSKIYGDADPVLGFMAEPVSAGRGLITGDTLQGALTRAAGETVGSYAIARGTLTNANYTIDFIPAALSIAKRSITLVADTASKIYGEADPALGVYLAAGSTLGSVTVSDTLAEVTGDLWRQAGENVGSYDVLLGTGSRAGNYDISYASDNAAMNILQRPLTIVADAQSKIYGDADPALGFVAESSSTGRGLLAADVLEGSLSRAAGEGVGSYAIAQGALANANYAIDFVTAYLTIGKRSITLVADVANKIYGESDPLLAVRLAPGSTLGSVTVSDALAQVTGNLHRQGGERVGSYDVLLGQGSRAANYTIDFERDNDALRIFPRPLEVRALAQGKLFGDVDPGLTWLAEGPTAGRGLLARDHLFGELERAGGEVLGSYAIEQGTLTNDNYVISFRPGLLDIMEPSLPVPAEGAIGDVQRPVTPAQAPSATLARSDGERATRPGSSGGLQFVDIAEAQVWKQGEASLQELNALGGQGEVTGFRPVFVVDGGIKLPRTGIVGNDAAEPSMVLAH